MSMTYSTFVVVGMAIFTFVPGFYGKVLGRVIFGLGMEPLEVRFIMHLQQIVFLTPNYLS